MASMDPVPNCSASIPSRGAHSHDRESLAAISAVAVSPASAKVEPSAPDTPQSFQNCIFGGLQQSQPPQQQPMEEVEVPSATSPSCLESKMDVLPAAGTAVVDSGDLSTVTFQPIDSKSARSSPPLSASTSATASSSPAKRPRHKPGERRELLLLAVNDVLSQSISMRKAAQRYNLAKSSLCDFVRKNNIQLPNNRYKTASSNSSAPAKTTPGSASPQTADTPTEAVCDATTTTTAGDSCPSDSIPDRNGSCSPQTSGPLKLPLNQAAVAAARSLLNGLSIQTTIATAVNDSLSALSTIAATSANNGTVEARPETRCSRTSLGTGLSLHDPRLFTSSTPPTSSSGGGGNLAACPRMESPWHNVSGLPTQVPIGNWGVWPVMNPKNTSLAHFAGNVNSNTTTTTASLCKVPVSLISESLRSSPVAAACTVSDDAVMQIAGRFSDSGEDSYAAGRTTAVVSAPGFVSPVAAASAPSAADYLAASARSGLTPDLFPATGISLPPSVAAFGALLSASQPPTPANPLVGDLTSVAIARSLLQSSPGANPTGLPFPLQTPAVVEQQHQQTSSPTSAAAAAEAVLKGFNLSAEQPAPDLAATTVTDASTTNNNNSNSSDSCGRTTISAADYLKIAALVSQLPDLLEAAQSPASLIYQIQQKLLSGVFSANSPIVVGSCPQTLAAKCLSQPASSQQTPAKHSPRSLMAQARELINFINKSPSPFHVVRSVRDILVGHGFQELREDQVWKLRPNDCFYITKNRSSIFAVAVGGAYKPGNGFSIIGAHTDSPCLRLKPISERVKEGFVQLAVETYGGGLWYSWFDRDLTVAGRCLVRLPSGALEERLVHINRPIACVPSLAIHLNRDANKAFSPNPEQHLAPILCTMLTEQMANSPELAVGGSALAADMESEKPHSAMDAAASSQSLPSGSHPPALLKLLAEELNCAESDLVELELYFADTQPACLGGVHSEFIHAPRLDNQFNAFAGTHGLVNSLPSLKDDPNVRIICLYDHEEIGSRSAQGANSVYTAALFRRLTSALASSFEGNESAEKYCLFEQTMARSFLLSADQAHAVHPSWPERHEPAHKPAFHGGMVLKYNCSQSYATNGLTAAVVREVARRSAVPLQEFVIRQDQPCGGTIGPILSTQLGVPTADVGGAQLAMHSCREMTCTTSVVQAVALFTGYFEQLPNILQTMSFK